MTLDQTDFRYVQRIVREGSGMLIGRDKEYLVESRLSSLSRKQGFKSISGFVSHLQSISWGELHVAVVQALNTYETSFFRDASFFAVLKQMILPKVFRRRSNGGFVNLWCGACASGQEPYSVAITLCESIPYHQRHAIRFIASDISAEMVDYARRGLFSTTEIERGLPARIKDRYFTKVDPGWQISADIQSMIEFRTINLVDAWPPLPRMDIVFLRNVFIYLDLPSKRSVLRRLRRLLHPESYLFLGTGETTTGIDDAFAPVEPSNASCYGLYEAPDSYGGL